MANRSRFQGSGFPVPGLRIPALYGWGIRFRGLKGFGIRA